MRKSTMLWLTLAVFCGTSLFHTSQKVLDGRQKLSALEKSIAKEEESIRVLQAEWGYLNQPTRLEKLARQYLKLEPLKGHQFVSIDSIPERNAPPAAMPAIAEETPQAVVPPKKETPVKAEAVAPKPQIPPVKIIKPVTATAPKPVAPKPAATADAPKRNFGDLMKSLRVE